jgi:addiction module HigA family antidote
VKKGISEKPSASISSNITDAAVGSVRARAFANVDRISRQPQSGPLPHPSRRSLARGGHSSDRRTKTEIASLLGISRQHLYDILGERKPVSPTMAVRLGKLFGDGAGVWVRMQAAYDTWQAEQSIDVESIPTIRAA